MPNTRVLTFRGPQAASRAAGAIGASVVVAMLALAMYLSWQLRVQAIAAATRVAEDHTFSLAAHAAQVLSAADFLADGVARRIDEKRLATPAALAGEFGSLADQQMLATRQMSFEAIDAVSVFDADGRLVSTSRGYPAPAVTVSDREGFIAARDDLSAVTHVSAPVPNRVNGEWTFYVSRRLNTRDGQFMGVVMVGLSSRYFSGFYAALRLDRTAPKSNVTSMSLLRRDLTVLARAPYDERGLGHRIARQGAYGPLAPPGVGNDQQADFEPWDATAANADHVMLVTRAIEGFPLIVAVAMRDDLYLANWRRQAQGVGWFAGAAALFLLAAFTTLVRVLRRRERYLEEVERLRAAAEQASRAKTDFLATVSHEVRTPLNGILGTADLLVRAPLAPREHELASTLLTSGRNLLSIINDILDLSKIEAGELEIHVGPFEPRKLVHELLALFVHYADSKGLVLSGHTEADVPQAVIGDAGRVRQVLGNLVSNAIKFSDRGTVQVRLSYEAAAAGPPLLRFEVVDTGVGIPAEAHERIFLPFAQADGSISRRFGGTGLGLTISKRLVTLMQGTIAFTSAEGRGTCFWFELPLPATDITVMDPPPAHAHSDWTFAHSGAMPLMPVHDAPGTGHPRTRHVLVVEDNAVNAMVVEAQLERLDCHCDIACDGEEALHRLAAGPYDLVLMDCMLPGISGYEVVRRWRQIEQERGLRRLPIVALTASALASNAEEARLAGMDDFLTKPCTLDKLSAVTRQWFDQQMPATPRFGER
ncbi:ATP-binding protein [Ideonella sp.]|uniref:hybrid sensor histidine kinase/response regulator n=1 Tax=Ideonella sp. TaxID=1929293 RepID=UPI0035AE62B5